jgi:hypothetical protein|tara:strand:+ start:7299 stop:8006 length:708 start_codon:yes stop_codon:yes gene_type:complete
MTIDEIYRFVQFICNKEQRGFIKPSEFNLLADRVQLEVVNNRYSDISKYTTSKVKSGMVKSGPGMQYATHQKNTDDLRTLINHNVTLEFDGTNEVFDYPTDYLHLTSLSFQGNNVKVVNEDKLYSILGSSIVAPTTTRPVAVLLNEGIRIYTGPQQDSILTVGARCSYIKRPTRPIWGYQMINNNPVYNPSISTQFDLPDQTHNEIAIRILEYAGVNIKDADVVSVSGLKQKQSM